VTIDPLPVPDGSVHAAITREIVKLHAAHFGKGPLRARSYWAGDTLICQMEDILTPVERTLIEHDRGAQVYTLRRGFQDAMEGEFSAAVERLSGRRVRAFLSQVHLDPDVAIEIFMLEPASGA
jgi:uncharacterized protein YbcI